MISIWCVPEGESARFAHDIILADVYISAPEHVGGPPIDSTRKTAVFYSKTLPPIRDADSGMFTTNYVPWRLMIPPEEVNLHVVVEPAFADGFIGRRRFKDWRSWDIHDLQMEKDYINQYEAKFGKLDPAVRKGLTRGAYVAKKSSESIIATQISLMRRQALGVKVSPSDVGNAAAVVVFLAGEETGLPRFERLQLLTDEICFFRNVYRDTNILLRCVRQFLFGALNHMRGSEAYVRGPRAKQYHTLMNLSPAQLVEALGLLDNLALPAEVRMLAVADFVRRAIEGSVEISLRQNSTT